MLQTDEPAARRPPEKDQGPLWLSLLQRLPALPVKISRSIFTHWS